VGGAVDYALAPRHEASVANTAFTTIPLSLPAGTGSVSAFGSYTWDACLELASAIPQALKVAQPGTKEFRRALRDALEATKDLPVTNGVVNMGKTDHLGLDSRARVMVQIKDGKWVLQN
jgi:branched-chain amino acid transport system substrate-binding protein